MKRDSLRSRVRCLGGSPGRIGSRGRSALWELLLEAERERHHRPVRPNLRTPARTATQTSARSIFGAVVLPGVDAAFHGVRSAAGRLPDVV